MNILNEKQMRVVIVGATGMVGGYALRYMLEHKSVERVTAIGRRELGISHAIGEDCLRPQGSRKDDGH